ncbi:MAG TPA: TonB-dependent receptor [Vicinamibacterales bacterium]|nr:TonB-dependent receptor [Vicinamibacterales bacterium]
MIRCWFTRCAVIMCAVAGLAGAEGQIRGLVVDQDGLPVPGATVELRSGDTVVATVTSSADGTYVLNAPNAAGQVVVSLPGFATVSVGPADAARVVLSLAGVTERTTVTASGPPAGASTEATMGAALTATAMQRLPTARQHVNDALPLLPSVVRGPDGLLHVDGARPHEAPLLVDGFNVTDPATGLSAIDLPLESVSRVDVLRDPAAVTFGGALGPMVAVETRTGQPKLDLGAQGFVPRLRYGNGGFGRVEGFFPRAYVGGQSNGGRVQFFVSGEYDYERIRVPGVTVSRGSPDTKEVSGTLFGRVDSQLSDRHSITAEGIFFPGQKILHRLSPLRATTAAPTLADTDIFLGVVDRHVVSPTSLFTVRLGIVAHDTTVSPISTLAPELTPLGWNGASFSALDRRSSRVSATVSWQHSLATTSGTHSVTLESTVDDERLQGSVSNQTVNIRDITGGLLRQIEFGGASVLSASARRLGVALRDNWRVSDALQFDGGVRMDWNSLGGGATPSARVGARYALGDGATSVSGTVGRFVGTVPLTVPAFGGFPSRRDRIVDPLSGATLGSVDFTPAVAGLSLPRSWVATGRIERRLAPGWDALVGATLRRSSHLATLDVRPAEGALIVGSTGQAQYREVELALRHTWGDGDEAFVSYTRSSARGAMNDFSTLFAAGDTEVLRPGATARLPADTPHRWLGWFTTTLPRGFILAPAMEWHSGFPYTPLTARLDYATAPNSQSYPAFFSLDLGVFKTVDFRDRRIKAGIQVFNVTNHFNPRDVYAVPGTPRFGSFTNSVGPTLRGVLTFLW